MKNKTKSNDTTTLSLEDAKILVRSYLSNTVYLPKRLTTEKHNWFEVAKITLEDDLGEFPNSLLNAIKIKEIDHDITKKPSCRITYLFKIQGIKGKDILHTHNWFKNAFHAYACIKAYEENTNSDNAQLLLTVGYECWTDWLKEKDAAKRFTAFNNSRIRGNERQQILIITQLLEGKKPTEIELDEFEDVKETLRTAKRIQKRLIINGFLLPNYPGTKRFDLLIDSPNDWNKNFS